MNTVVYLQHGTKLTRHYNQGENPDVVCGTVAFYQNIENQLFERLSYFDRKFFSKVDFNVFAANLPLPINEHYAYTIRTGEYTSQICVRYSTDSYVFPAVISHEFGHAYENWIRCFNHHEFYRWWCRAITTNGVEYNSSAYPWNGGQRPEEQLANAYRALLGTHNTRNVTQPPKESTPPGFVDVATKQDWIKMFQLLPEACGYWRNFGLKDNTLSWTGSNFQFQNSSGEWIAQTNYYEWHKWNGWFARWERFYPSYVVF